MHVTFADQEQMTSGSTAGATATATIVNMGSGVSISGGSGSYSRSYSKVSGYGTLSGSSTSYTSQIPSRTTVDTYYSGTYKVHVTDTVYGKTMDATAVMTFHFNNSNPI